VHAWLVLGEVVGFQLRRRLPLLLLLLPVVRQD
jgi:hypothetical protein